MRLSELQRVILRLAYENMANGRAKRADVSPADVKRVYYGIPYRYPNNAAAVAIAKAFDRLTARGLTIRVYGWGVKMTPKGEKAVANFMTP